MARAFWMDSTSGDIFAVELNEDGEAWAAVGPLYYSDITAEYLDNLDVSTEEDAVASAEYLNGRDCRVLEDHELFDGQELRTGQYI